jgi:hypothetical protein
VLSGSGKPKRPKRNLKLEIPANQKKLRTLRIDRKLMLEMPENNKKPRTLGDNRKLRRKKTSKNNRNSKTTCVKEET